MTINQLASRIATLSPEQRQIVESLIDMLAGPKSPSNGQDQLTNHPSFGAWANRKDLPADSDQFARDLRERAVRRG